MNLGNKCLKFKGLGLLVLSGLWACSLVNQPQYLKLTEPLQSSQVQLVKDGRFYEQETDRFKSFFYQNLLATQTKLLLLSTGTAFSPSHAISVFDLNHLSHQRDFDARCTGLLIKSNPLLHLYRDDRNTSYPQVQSKSEVLGTGEKGYSEGEQATAKVGNPMGLDFGPDDTLYYIAEGRVFRTKWETSSAE